MDFFNIFEDDFFKQERNKIPDLCKIVYKIDSFDFRLQNRFHEFSVKQSEKNEKTISKSFLVLFKASQTCLMVK
jgi:hypothetical protein